MFVLLSLILGLSTALLQNNATDTASALIFILDASGSMWGKIGNGQLYDASITVHSQTTGARIAGGRSYDGPQSNRSLELHPDLYPVTTGSVTIDGPGYKQVFRDVEVLPSQRMELKCEISQGILRVGATHDGKLWHCTVNVNTISPKENVAGGRTYTSASNNLKSIWLAPGSYEVVVKPLRLEVNELTMTIQVKAGETVIRSQHSESLNV